MRTVAFLLLLVTTTLRAEDTLRVAVAANFKPALERINRQFSEQSGISVLLSGASTGVLATQIEHGAPFDLFFAADRAAPERLARLRDDKDQDAFCYAWGSLVLAGADTLSALSDPGRSVAIANPVTAPYGRAAGEVLARPDFAAGSARKLVRGNSVAQAYQFWRYGAVDLALLPRSLAPDAGVPVPADWHAPIEQYAVALGGGAPVDAYLAWMRSDTVRALILEAGYEPCP